MTVMIPQSPTGIAASVGLCNKNILVSFEGGYYHWLKRDTLAAAELAKSRGISDSAFTAYKNIFLGADKLLNQIKGAVNAARTYHGTVTLASPWRGYTLLPNIHIEEYRQSILRYELELDKLLAELRTTWPEMLATAAQALGPAFAAEAYPPVDDVIKQCWMKFAFAPVPDPTGFKVEDIDPAVAQQLRDMLTAEVTDATEAAVAQLGDQLMTILENARTNLSKVKEPGVHFRTEWHSNLTEALPKLQAFLGRDNPAIAALVQRMENFLSSTPPEELKKKVEARAEAVPELDNIIAAFGTMFGKEEK